MWDGPLLTLPYVSPCCAAFHCLHRSQILAAAFTAIVPQWLLSPHHCGSLSASYHTAVTFPV